MKKCQARIMQVVKGKRIINVAWKPHTPETDGLEECGGTIHIALDVVGGCGGHDSDEYCYCESPGLEATITCTRCTLPYFPGIESLRSYNSSVLAEVERLIND